METQTIKGITFKKFIVKDSFNRRAQQFKNRIIEALRKLGVHEDQTDIPMPQYALRNEPAYAEWYMDGYRLYYDHSLSKKYVENLYVVAQVITHYVEAVLNEEKTIQDFIEEFYEDDEVEEQRKEARELLGLDEDETDMEIIDQRYKELAKEHHPDTATGNVDKFKAINKAHKILKRELK